jgi:hypothetical protein
MLPKRHEKEGEGSMRYAIGTKIRRVTTIRSRVWVRVRVRVRDRDRDRDRVSVSVRALVRVRVKG